MPTAAKLTAAVFFAILGWFGGDLVIPLLPEGTRTGLLNETLAALGAIMGTMMSGRRAGDSYRAAFGYGLTSVGLIVFWGIFSFSGAKMLEMSLDRRFKGPVQALQEMVGIFMDYAAIVASPTVIYTAIVGGLFGGWLTEWISRRWS